MTTRIPWTAETWNPVIGCSRAHTGCQNCYAERMCARRLPAFERHNRCVTNGRWNGHIEFLPERLSWPFERWKPRRNSTGRRIFVTSLGDLGHPNVSDEQRAAVYGAMLLSPWNTYQNLTKRLAELARFKQEWTPRRCVKLLAEMADVRWTSGKGWLLGSDFEIIAEHDYSGGHLHTRDCQGGCDFDCGTPVDTPESWDVALHIHEYVSVSDQETADALIPELLAIPAAMRGLSLEPLVGAIDFSRCIADDGFPYNPLEPAFRNGVGWVRRINHLIIGCESGPRRRPCWPEWVKLLVEQATDAGCPVFVKQLDINGRVSHDPAEWPEWAQRREMP